jgi:RNA polymerase sigma-70 factor, ECF subfamily
MATANVALAPAGRAAPIAPTLRVVAPVQDAPLADSTSEELLVAVAGGDRRAFELLFDRVSPQVLGVALRVLRDRALAEEVSQEVMVEVWRKAQRFDPARGTA